MGAVRHITYVLAKAYNAEERERQLLRVLYARKDARRHRMALQSTMTAYGLTPRDYVQVDLSGVDVMTSAYFTSFFEPFLLPLSERDWPMVGIACAKAAVLDEIEHHGLPSLPFISTLWRWKRGRRDPQLLCPTLIVRGPGGCNLIRHVTTLIKGRAGAAIFSITGEDCAFHLPLHLQPAVSIADRPDWWDENVLNEMVARCIIRKLPAVGAERAHYALPWH